MVFTESVATRGLSTMMLSESVSKLPHDVQRAMTEGMRQFIKTREGLFPGESSDESLYHLVYSILSEQLEPFQGDSNDFVSFCIGINESRRIWISRPMKYCIDFPEIENESLRESVEKAKEEGAVYLAGDNWSLGIDSEIEGKEIRSVVSDNLVFEIAVIGCAVLALMQNNLDNIEPVDWDKEVFE
jgi:hypothetical protein